MTKEEHIKRHVELHKSFDELLTDFIRHTKKTITLTTLMEFLKWSHSQTIEPTEED